MSYIPHLIAPFSNGLVKYYKPWLIGDDAFADLEDAYARRGVIRKREGFRLLASFPASDKPVQGLKNWVNPSTLNESLIGFSQTKSYLFGSSFTDITFFANPAGTAFSWSNSANDYFWSSNHAGSMWVTNNLTADHIKFWNGTPGALGVSGGWSTHQPTVNGTNTLDVSLIILPYKGRLVVLNTSEGGNPFPNRARWSQLGTPYSGNQAAVNITNIVPGATTQITVTSGAQFAIGQLAGVLNTTGSISAVLNFNTFSITNVAVNVITLNVNTTGLAWISGGTLQGQGTTTPPTPYTVDPFAWRDDIPGRGGFIDADTSERIVSADIVKDTLIVAFQRSTWRLRYTGNEILPFIWERLNTQYGAEATHSHVAFDESCLFYSRYGWIGSDTNDVARIDMAIPDDSFSLESIDSNLSGMNHVHAIRDFYRQFAYWTFNPAGQTNSTQIYAFNYLDKTWAIFNPQTGTSGSSTPLNIRTFGYYHTTADSTWASFNSSTDIWSNFGSADDIWSNFASGEVINFPYVVGGDNNGNVYQMFEFFDTPTTDNGTNFPFTIETKSFNPFIEKGKKARLAYVDLYCTSLPGGEITVQHLVDDQTSPVITKTVELFSRGVISISSITPGTTTTIVTSTDHELETNETVTFSNIIGSIGSVLNNENFSVTVVDAVTFNIAVNTTGLIYTQDGVIWNAFLPQGNAKYTRIYLGAIAHFHQLIFTLSNVQVLDPVKGAAQFEMQGLVLWFREEGRIRG